MLWPCFRTRDDCRVAFGRNASFLPIFPRRCSSCIIPRYRLVLDSRRLKSAPRRLESYASCPTPPSRRPTRRLDPLVLNVSISFGEWKSYADYIFFNLTLFTALSLSLILPSCLIVSLAPAVAPRAKAPHPPCHSAFPLRRRAVCRRQNLHSFNLPISTS